MKKAKYIVLIVLTFILVILPITLKEKDTNNDYSYIENNNIEIDIEADGGINLATAPDVKKAGANILVSGTAILMANDFKVIIDELKK